MKCCTLEEIRRQRRLDEALLGAEDAELQQSLQGHFVRDWYLFQPSRLLLGVNTT
jgi:hypothetical protein